jgi:hypothetical protein
MARWDEHEPYMVFVGVRMRRGTKRQLDALCRHLQQRQSAVLRTLIEERAKRLGLHKEADTGMVSRPAEAVPA